jgi:hypothetical protein
MKKMECLFLCFSFPPHLLLPSSENEDGGEGHTAYEGQKAHATSSPRPPQCKQTSEMQMTNRREPSEMHSCLFPFFSLARKRRALENSWELLRRASSVKGLLREPLTRASVKGRCWERSPLRTYIGTCLLWVLESELDQNSFFFPA